MAETDQERAKRLTGLLPIAVESGSMGDVQTFLRGGASAEGLVEAPVPPLVLAASDGFLSMVHVLLANGACTDSRAKSTSRALLNLDAVVAYRGQSALHAAVMGSCVDVVRVLLMVHANPNARDGMGRTPLMLCRLAEDRLTIMQDLLAVGADPAEMSNSGVWCALNMAAVDGFTEAVRMCLSKAPSAINHTNQRGETALYHAAERGHADTVSFLLSAGARQSGPYDSQNCPLCRAAKYHRVAAVRVLAERGIQALGGGQVVVYAALIVILTVAPAKILQLLLSAKDPSVVGFIRKPPLSVIPLLHLAAGYSMPVYVSLLLTAGAHEDDTDEKGRRACDVVGTMELDQDCDDGESTNRRARARNREDEPANNAAIRRLLERGPAFRARSSAWAARKSDVDAAADVTAPPKPKVLLGVQIFRPRDRKFFVEAVGRYVNRDALARSSLWREDALEAFTCK